MGARVTLRMSGLRWLLRTDEVQSIVDERAARIAAAAGENFEVSSVGTPARHRENRHKWVARAYVQNKNYEGAVEEATDKKLTGAVGA